MQHDQLLPYARSQCKFTRCLEDEPPRSNRVDVRYEHHADPRIVLESAHVDIVPQSEMRIEESKLTLLRPFPALQTRWPV